MRFKFKSVFHLGLMIFLMLSFCAEAGIVIQNGKIRDADTVATLPVQEHFSLGVAAMNEENWDEAALQFAIVTLNFPASSYVADAYYYLGVSQFHIRELDAANNKFSEYLKAQQNPKFFEQAIEYKFAIAEAFRKGARRRLFGSKQMPKWASGRTLALNTYDEVISALPCHPIAAHALFSKGNLLWEIQSYKESVDCFQMLIKRFPKHELAPESYVAITKVYLEQSQKEFQNPDLLALAQINVRRFSQDFPKEARLEDAENNVIKIKEIYANGLYETGQFYERVNKPRSSVLYYKNAIRRFPDTEVAQQCKMRLEEIDQQANG